MQFFALHSPFHGFHNNIVDQIGHGKTMAVFHTCPSADARVWVLMYPLKPTCSLLEFRYPWHNLQSFLTYPWSSLEVLWTKTLWPTLSLSTLIILSSLTNLWAVFKWTSDLQTEGWTNTNWTLFCDIKRLDELEHQSICFYI